MGRSFKKYEDPDLLLERIESYFDETDPREQTRAGLCIKLGITMPTYRAYREDPVLREPIEWAETRLENKYNLDLNTKANPTGSIFALKQFGWSNKQEHDVKGYGTIKIISSMPRPDEE